MSFNNPYIGKSEESSVFKKPYQSGGSKKYKDLEKKVGRSLGFPLPENSESFVLASPVFSDDPVRYVGENVFTLPSPSFIPGSAAFGETVLVPSPTFISSDSSVVTVGPPPFDKLPKLEFNGLFLTSSPAAPTAPTAAAVAPVATPTSFLPTAPPMVPFGSSGAGIMILETPLHSEPFVLLFENGTTHMFEECGGKIDSGTVYSTAKKELSEESKLLFTTDLVLPNYKTIIDPHTGSSYTCFFVALDQAYSDILLRYKTNHDQFIKNAAIIPPEYNETCGMMRFRLRDISNVLSQLANPITSPVRCNNVTGFVSVLSARAASVLKEFLSDKTMMDVVCLNPRKVTAKRETIRTVSVESLKIV